MMDEDKPIDLRALDSQLADIKNFLIDLESQLSVEEGDTICSIKMPQHQLDATKTHGTVNLTAVQDAVCKEANESRWITAIHNVPPKSGSFWYEYGQRYDEKVLIVLLRERNRHGHRCCSVQVYSKRPISEVVQTAWNEYNRHLVSVKEK